MKPRISLITLGVDDLEASLVFYRDGLGLRTEGIINGAVVFFELEGRLKLALYPRASLAKDAGIEERDYGLHSAGRRGSSGISLAHNVMSREEVDRVMEQARMAGAVIVQQARDTFWGGYAGYFQDPDGHLWEVAWNPQMLPES
jgi:catechol 2,3-dioxygenase-like lactoylglutathione lyase family enzyme